MLPTGYQFVKSNSLYQADIGLISPISYCDRDYKIQPFFSLHSTIQDRVIQELEREWPVMTYEYINKNFTCGDYLFVATDTLGFVGTVAVDRKGFLPYLGTLYVTPRIRGFGHSKQLISFAETFIKEILNFNEVHLWCEESMIDFYLPFGYIYQSKEDDGNCILKKLI